MKIYRVDLTAEEMEQLLRAANIGAEKIIQQARAKYIADDPWYVEELKKRTILVRVLDVLRTAR